MKRSSNRPTKQKKREPPLRQLSLYKPAASRKSLHSIRGDSLCVRSVVSRVWYTTITERTTRDSTRVFYQNYGKIGKLQETRIKSLHENDQRSSSQPQPRTITTSFAIQQFESRISARVYPASKFVSQKIYCLILENSRRFYWELKLGRKNEKDLSTGRNLTPSSFVLSGDSLHVLRFLERRIDYLHDRMKLVFLVTLLAVLYTVQYSNSAAVRSEVRYIYIYQLFIIIDTLVEIKIDDRVDFFFDRICMNNLVFFFFFCISDLSTKNSYYIEEILLIRDI